jgi:PAS domain-containing protein
LPGFTDRRQLVALAVAQVGQALAILGSEARRRDAEIVGLENAWLREVSKRAAGESERVRALHESLRTRTAELERVSASLRGLFDALSEHGVVAWDVDGLPTARNATATALYGKGSTTARRSTRCAKAACRRSPRSPTRRARRDGRRSKDVGDDPTAVKFPCNSR